MLLGGAALTRNYVERDLRALYEGRLFYGKDAFEGLRTMDELMEGKRTGTLDPDFGRALGGRDLPPRKSEREAAEAAEAAGDAEPEATAPTSRPTSRSSCRRSSAHASRRASRSTRSSRYVNETALFRNQWQFRPTRTAPRPTTSSRRASGPTLREELASSAGRRLARARGRVGLLPRELRGQRPHRVDRRRPAHRAPALRVPAPAQGPPPLHRRLLPPGRLRRRRLRGVPRRDDGRRPRPSTSASCSRPTATRSTCCATASRSR